VEALFDPAAPRRRTSVSVNADLLRQAKELGIPLSGALEQRLVELIRARRQRAWLERNRKAIAAANGYLERHGLPIDERRQF